MLQGRTNVDPTQLFRSLVIRGIAVGVMGALVFYLGKSMVDSLLEEVSGGLL